MEQNIEYGKFSELVITNLFFPTCYATYYSEKYQQLYLIDYGINKYWLGLIAPFAPLFFKYMSFKAYPINDNDIEYIKDNLGYKIGNYILAIGTVIGSLIFCSTHSLRRPIEERERLLPENYFLATHENIAILLWLLTMLAVIFLTAYFKPISLKNREYIKIKAVAKFSQLPIIQKLKFVGLEIMTILVGNYISFSIFCYGIIFIPASLSFFLLVFNCIAGFNKRNKYYTGKIIFEN